MFIGADFPIDAPAGCFQGELVMLVCSGIIISINEGGIIDVFFIIEIKPVPRNGNFKGTLDNAIVIEGVEQLDAQPVFCQNAVICCNQRGKKLPIACCGLRGRLGGNGGSVELVLGCGGRDFWGVDDVSSPLSTG